MRQVDLNWLENPKGDFVESLRAPGSVILAPFVQGDTIRLAVTKVVKAESGLVPLTVKPWSFDQIRVSIGYIDKRPDKGTFKLTIAGSPTATITLPTDWDDAAAVATWKADVITKINAVAGANAARLDDPVDAPAHLLFITWTSTTDEREIGISNVSIVPPIDTQSAVQVLQPAPAFSQVVKLSTLPLVIASDFEFPDPPAPEIAGERDGSASANEVQLLILPEGITGAFDLLWDSSRTTPLAVSGLTADKIAQALNAIVVDGGSNPSFAVTERAVQIGRKFAIEFIGPLAGADQALLVATPRDQDASLTAFGDMELRREAFERALYGQSEIKLQLEFVVTADGGESTVLREITLLNDMTSGATETSAEEQGAVFVRTEQVIVDNSTLTPLATVAVGGAFTPPSALAAGAELLVNHNLGSRKVRVRVLYESSESPEQWRELQLGGEFEYYSTSTAQVSISFAFAITNTPGDEWYRGRLQVQVISPDSTVQLMEHQHTWDEVRVSLPSGQTLTSKLADIEAALGMVDGTSAIPASRITGLLKAGQIDLTSLAAGLESNERFLATLITLGKSSAFLTAISEELRNNSAFLETLKLFAANDEFLAALLQALEANDDFESTIIRVVNAALAGGTGLPIDSVPLVLPAFSFTWPPQVEVTFADAVVPTLTVFAPLPCAVLNVSSGGNVAGELNAASIDTTKYFTVSGSAFSRDVEARRGEDFSNGVLVANHQGIWFALSGSSGDYYPAEMEKQIGSVSVNSRMLREGTQLVVTFPVQAQLRGGATGQGVLILEQGVPTATGSAPANLASMTWTSRFEQTILLTDALASHILRLTVVRPVGGGALTASLRCYGADVTLSPSNNPDGAWRLRFGNFDVINSTDLQRGSLLIQMLNPLAAIVPIE
jgi:hypothetical protein